MLRWLLPALLLILPGCHDEAEGGAGARRAISVVGSSTVFPFTTTVAEAFVAAAPKARSPVIESTGTGAGMRLFCGGVGASYPDIEDASRRMEANEYAACAAHGARDILEIQIGIDGIAIAGARNGPAMALTPATLYRALAAAPGGKPNQAQSWRDVDPALPATPIRVYGPPATSGTRDAFAALMLAVGCVRVDPAARVLARRDPDAYRARCTRIREDGAYVDAGENDNLIVQKLIGDPAALGVFGYSYLEENAAAVRAVPVDGVLPTRTTIADGRYPGSRPLYLYVKKAHLVAVPGLRAFLALYAGSWDADGPLARRGLIAAPEAVRRRSADIVAGAIPLDPSELPR